MKKRDATVRAIHTEPQAQQCEEGGDTFASRLLALQGDMRMSEFARRCGIGESLLRKYVAGSRPGADKVAQIAAANSVSVDWLASGRGPGPASSTDGQSLAHHVEQVIEDYGDAAMIELVLKAVSDSGVSLSEKKQAQLIAAGLRTARAVRDRGLGSDGLTALIRALIELAREEP